MLKGTRYIRPDLPGDLAPLRWDDAFGADRVPDVPAIALTVELGVCQYEPEWGDIVRDVQHEQL